MCRRIDKWVGDLKVLAFHLEDEKLIYFNVQAYLPGQSISKGPQWEKTVYITDNEAGQQATFYYTATLVRYVAQMNILPGTKVVLTFEENQLWSKLLRN